MIIKEFTLSDYESVHALWYGTEGVCKCEKCTFLDSREQIEKYLLRNPAMSFIAVENGHNSEDTVVGAILAGHDGRTGLIYRLTVAEEFRNRGIAGQLVEKSLEALKAEGLIAVKIFVLGDNDTGNAFWEKIGFKKFDIAVTRGKEIG